MTTPPSSSATRRGRRGGRERGRGRGKGRDIPPDDSPVAPVAPHLAESSKDEQNAETVEEELEECKFLEHRYLRKTDEAGQVQCSWEIIPAGSAPPSDSSRRASTDKYGNYSMVFITDYDASGKTIDDKKLQVHSPALKEVISRCVGYRHTRWKVSDSDPVEISWPWEDWFRGLAYFKEERSRLGEQIAEKNNQGTPIERAMTSEYNTCKILIDIIEQYHEGTIKEMNACIQQGFVTYDLLWTLFDTYQEVYTKGPGNTARAYEFLSGDYDYCSDQWGKAQPKYYRITCRYLDYDGEDFGWLNRSFLIRPFKGKLKITSLPIYPFIYHPDKEKMREELIMRGRKFESLRGIHYMRYGFKQAGEVESVAQRLMIDTYEYRRQDRDWDPSDFQKLDWEENSLEVMRELKEVGYCLPLEGTGENGNKDIEMEETTTLDENEKPYTPLPDFYCLLATNAVGAFDLRSKRWKAVNVTELTQPTWNTNAFSSLVLDQTKKDLIKALVEQHIQDSSRGNSFDDFIAGKGKGLIYVLHGPPGVGKTLTAEAVSEYTKSPLYVISAGELGTSACSIEDSLNSAFELCARWNALMLLDEADIFMEARSLHELDRNACVSVFLKVLEYYEGILFLTTNRVSSFDEAFRSRVHLTMRFDELTNSARLKIWEAFVNKMRINGVKVDISEEGLAKLAMKPLNGREIKNTVKLAQSLARNEEGTVNTQALLKIISIQEAFEPDSPNKN